MRLTISDVQQALLQHWGLSIYRNTRAARGRRHTEWRTGYTVHGPFPGYSIDWRRYSSLAEVARVFQLEPIIAALHAGRGERYVKSV